MTVTERNEEASPVVAYSYGRLSQKKQEDGSGQERQIELAKEWCARKGIPLDETRSFFDKRSGFHGRHRKHKDGGLYRFLLACERGWVQAGSYLLVESLDRLSREQLQEGQALIKRLLFDYKVKLVVLFTTMEYTAENYQQTHWSIDAEFDRAYSESFHKSVRSKSNWESRRKLLADGGVLTLKIPTWLKVKNGKPARDEVKADVVIRIFAMAANGFGFSSIALKLNAEKITPFGRGKFWRDSVVEKILKSRATLGEFQPMKFELVQNGKEKKLARVPAGPVVAGYFPAVVTADQWRTAQQAIGARKLARGRITPKVSNLFTGLVYDAAGDVMAYTSKNHKGYLQTGRKDSPGIRYSFFERSLLHWLREVRVRFDNAADVSTLQARADKLADVLRVLKAKIDTEPELLGDLVDIYEAKKRDHMALLRDIETASVPLQAQFMQAKWLAEALAKTKGDDLELLRREVRQAIRLTVARIDVKVKGEKWNGKRVEVKVTFRDGLKRDLYYTVRAGRVVEGGLLLEDRIQIVGPATTKEEKTDWLVGMLKRVRVEEELKAEVGEFPTDPDPAADIRAKCKAMRAAKKSYKQIEAVTGLHRTTIYRYLKDYVRADR